MATLPKGLRLTLDDRDLNRRLKKVEASVAKGAAAKGLRAAALWLMAQMKVYLRQSSGLEMQSGNLLGSITEDELVLGKKSYITFGPHTVYAAIHEFGGVIEPTHAPFLVFVGKDGNLVFTKKVVMPARPYVRPVMDRDGNQALDLLGKTIGNILDGEWI